MNESNSIISDFFRIGGGLPFTLALAIGGILIGIFLGALLAVLRYNGIGRWMINGIVSFLRGTPFVLQLTFIYFVMPKFGLKLNVLWAGILAFGINSSAYVAEIFRAGIENLPKGQFEAAKTLEIPRFYMWKDIILPQVTMNILPILLNEMIDIIKMTAVIPMIGGIEIMRKAQMVSLIRCDYFLPLCMAATYYYGLVLLIEFIGKKIEKRKLYAKNL
ncbi:MAG: amino acid ABC transporter permease [Puniceicoccales bacterium]|jgi:polar amino acid transport system permease protein|nr:amino acid ABC transporter permease [Puniceicoccales bacterium]